MDACRPAGAVIGVALLLLLLIALPRSVCATETQGQHQQESERGQDLANSVPISVHSQQILSSQQQQQRGQQPNRQHMVGENNAAHHIGPEIGPIQRSANIALESDSNAHESSHYQQQATQIPQIMINQLQQQQQDITGQLLANLRQQDQQQAQQPSQALTKPILQPQVQISQQGGQQQQTSQQQQLQQSQVNQQQQVQSQQQQGQQQQLIGRLLPLLPVQSPQQRQTQQQQQQQQQQAQLQSNPPPIPELIQYQQPVVSKQQQPQQQPSQQKQQPNQLQQQQQQQLSSMPTSYSNAPPDYHNQHQHPSLYPGYNPFIEILKPRSYADDNIVTLNLSHSHIYEIDSDAFVGQRFEHIDLSNNKLGLIQSRSFRIGPTHSRHNPYSPDGNASKSIGSAYLTRRPPPEHPKSVTIDFSHNPAIWARPGAFDHIDVPNCLLNFANSTVDIRSETFKKYFKDHPGHIIDIESVDCCEQEWLLGYKHNFVSRTYCAHDPSLLVSKVPQQTIIDSCIAYVTSARHSMTFQEPSFIHARVAAAPRGHANPHTDTQYLTYLILGGTAMTLTSLSIYIIFYMFSLKAALVCQMQSKN